MRNIINGKVLIAALVLGSIMLCGAVIYILIFRPAASPPAPAAVALTIFPADTSTPTPLPPTPTSTPVTPEASLTPAPGQVAVGVYVQPSTGGDGLRVHSDPTLSASFFSAFDSEVFLVTDGPRTADGYTWWKLTASYDSTRSGWAVQDFLVAIPSH